MTRWLDVSARVAVVLAFSAGVTLAQSVISAKSGTVHYVEGDVTIDGHPVEMKASIFPDIKENQVFETKEGRAEILLTPGVFLRLGEDTSFRMVSNRLTDTRVEVLTGSILVEHGEISKETSVTLLFEDRAITFLKSGLYRLDASTGTLRVYQGQARVEANGQSLTAKQAREVDLRAPVLMAAKFDNKTTDEFHRWASRRASYLALANISAAKALYDSGVHLDSGLWHWNSYYGMFTYVPYGRYYSPFGYAFWSPSRVMDLYRPRPVYSGGGGPSWSDAGSGRYSGSSSGFGIGSRASSGGYSSSGASTGSVGNSSSGGASSGGAVSGTSSGSSGGRGR
jgi:hypothetical protein